MIELRGEIVEHSGMWTTTITQHSGKFILSSWSEMMDKPHEETFDSLQDVVNEMYKRT